MLDKIKSVYKLFNCEDKNLYTNDEFKQSLEKLFQVAKKICNEYDFKPEEQVGDVITSCIISDIPQHVFNVDRFDNLYEWICNKLMSVSSSFGIENPKEVKISRAWANKMYKGSSGLCHNHISNKEYSGVAIFYVSVPEGSSDIVFVDGGVNNTPLSEYPEDVKEYVKLKDGDLLIHESDSPHAVTEHKSDDPRMCIVLDFCFE